MYFAPDRTYLFQVSSSLAQGMLSLPDLDDPMDLAVAAQARDRPQVHCSVYRTVISFWNDLHIFNCTNLAHILCNFAQNWQKKSQNLHKFAKIMHTFCKILHTICKMLYKYAKVCVKSR